jgi:4'-phosphopantetheinyl transferase
MSSLSPKEAHVWTISVTDNDQKNIDKFSHVLCPDELGRLEHIKHKQSKLEYQAAHILCRVMLSNFSDVAPADWLFEIGEHGKPEINEKLNHENLRFNISHTNGMVACALTTKYDIGVDLEWPSRNNCMNKIAKKKFTESEFNYLKAKPPTEQRKVFSSLWTLKESYLKAVGKGLLIPLNSFSFDLNTLEISFLDNKRFHNSGCWKFALLKPSDDHLCALCVAHPKNSPQKIKHQQVHWQDFDKQISSSCAIIID